MEKNPVQPWWQPGLVVFAEVTGWLAAPIVAALFLGKYLDERNGTAPWYFLGLTGLAFIVTSIGIVSIATKYIRKIEAESRAKKQGNGKSNNITT